MIYQGSKNRISKHILPIVTKYLAENRYYVEPFCGGCNLIDKIDHPFRMANDINKYLIALFKYVLAGKALPNFIEKAEYYKVKANKDDYEDWYVGFVGFLNMPKDGEVVEVLSYGKVETMRFDKPYMSFNPPSITRLGGWDLGLKKQEGITHFRRIDHNR